jgi:biopolymer transport protein ExbB
MERAVEETADLVATRRVRSLEYLNVMGAVGPMIGLFGTVYGMIVAFQTIVDRGGNPSPEDLAAGISTALVTTFWGLVVGIPAVAAAALIRNRIDVLMTEAIVETEALISRFRTAGKKSSGAAAPRKPAAPQPKPAAPPQPKPA